MTLIKNEFPILERDTAVEAVIKPDRYGFAFPERAVFAFLGDEIDRYAAENQGEQIGEFETITKIFPVYKVIFQGVEITLCQAPLGSAAAAQMMDFLIGSGVQKIISTGCCGALTDWPENHWLIPIEALRDEGTSYHYLPASRSILLDRRAVSAIEKVLESSHLAFETCKTWTTDAFYRETPEMVCYRMAEGCQVVEMECSALAAVAAFREVSFGQLLFTADTLTAVDSYDDRGWGRDSFKTALELSLEAVAVLD